MAYKPAEGGSQQGSSTRPVAGQGQLFGAGPPEAPGPARPLATAPPSPPVPGPQVSTQSPGRYILYILFAGVLAVTVAVTIVVVDWLRTIFRKGRGQPGDDEDPAERQQLVARADGREIALGPLASIRHLAIGAGSKAAIPIAGDGILPRHVTLKRDRNSFVVRNHSRTPMTANGVPIPPRRRGRVVLPADFIVGEQIKVALRIHATDDAEEQVTSRGAPLCQTS